MASNALLVGASRSATGHPLAVMGPQLGYFYPEIVMQIDLHGGGIDAEGVAPPTEPYVLIGRGKGFAWSLTSATSQNTEQFLSKLCNPDGSPATRGSASYVYKGRCVAMTSFNAGVLGAGGSTPAENVVYHQTIYGPVNGTVLVHGAPYAISNLRSTRGREPMSALALADLNDGQVRSPHTFLKAASEFETTFNWFYVDAKNIAYYSSGRLPVNARGTNPDLPTLGNGQYSWHGFLTPGQHPQAVNPASGLIVNWNNKPAPGWGAADDNYGLGAVHRVQLFNGFKRTGNTLANVVSIMNRAATQDLRAVASGRSSPGAGRRPGAVAAGPAGGQPRQRVGGRRGEPTRHDGQRPDHRPRRGGARHRLARAGRRRPRAGAGGGDPGQARGGGARRPGPRRRHRCPGHMQGNHGSSFESAWYGYVNKDLRSELGRSRQAAHSAAGIAATATWRPAAASLWAAVQAAATSWPRRRAPTRTRWHSNATAERITFLPGLIPFTMRWTNRSTFQQAISFGSSR